MSTRFGSLVDMAEESFCRFRSRALFGQRLDGEWAWLTYGELDVIVAELRAGLAALGVCAGERVAIVSRNSAMWAAAAHACFGLGAAFVPMYEAQRPSDWEFILRDSGASVVFGRSPALVAALDEMQPRLPALRHVLAIEGSADARSLEAIRRSGRAHAVDAIRPEPATLAELIYTSGTTGKPKGVMLSHGNFVSNVASATQVFPFYPEDRTLSFLPWAHAYGQIGDLHIVMSAGSSVAINDDIARLSDDMLEVRPTMLIAVPRIFNKLYATIQEQVAARPRAIQRLFERGVAASIRRRRGAPLTARELLAYKLADRLSFEKVRARFGGNLRCTISASAALSLQVAEFIDALGMDVYEGYGLTEATPIVSANCPGARKLGSVGRAIPGVTIRIDESRGETAGQGEIVVYGPNVMLGYLGRPEENEQAFTADGGLRTGDIGYLDADGYLFVTGRIKEQYKLENGEYVLPSAVEEQLALSPYIQSAMLYGANRPYNVALVVLDVQKLRAWARSQGVSAADLAQHPAVRALISDEIRQHAARLKGYERPRAFVLTLEPFTVENGMLTPTLKLKRRHALERYEAALEKLYDEQREPEPKRPKQRPQPRAHSA